MGTNMGLHVEAFIGGAWRNRTVEAGAEYMHDGKHWGPSERNYAVYGRLNDVGWPDRCGPIVPSDRAPAEGVDREAISRVEGDGYLSAEAARWATVAELRAADWTHHLAWEPWRATDLSGDTFVVWLRGPLVDAVVAEAGDPERVRLLWWWT
jgi:hypothetical protein